MKTMWTVSTSLKHKSDYCINYTALASAYPTTHARSVAVIPQ